MLDLIPAGWLAFLRRMEQPSARGIGREAATDPYPFRAAYPA